MNALKEIPTVEIGLPEKRCDNTAATDSALRQLAEVRGGG